jgi:hypothetical protein
MSTNSYKTVQHKHLNLTSKFELHSYDGGNYQKDNYYKIENILSDELNHYSLKPKNCLLILKFSEFFLLEKIKITGTHCNQTVHSGF